MSTDSEPASAPGGAPFALVLFLNGLVWIFFSLLMLVPALAGSPDAWHFLTGAAASGFTGAALLLTGRRGPAGFRPRDAFMLVTTAWISGAAAGAVPMAFWGLSVTDATFESMSALTTTGSTVIAGLDGMHPPVLIWRALLQWVGGLGIIVTGIAILPMLKIGGMQLFRAESSDKGDKELTSAAGFAAATFQVYLALTVACALAYMAAGMGDFDAILHALTTVSTGGFSTHDASMGHFSEPAIHWVGTVFMLSGSLPFIFYIRAVRRKVLASEQVRIYLISLAVLIAGLTAYRVATADVGFWEALRLSAFNLVSVVTTTGFAAGDYTTWGAPVVALFLIVTFFGGCTGSTSGGMKAMRLILVYRFIHAAMLRVRHPHMVIPVRFEGHPADEAVRSSVIAFFSVFLFTYVITVMALNLIGLDFETSVSGAIAALANVGPGVGTIIGPAGNFVPLPDAAKWVLTVAMLLGRLEVLTGLVVVSAAYWGAWPARGTGAPQAAPVSRATRAR